MEPSVEGPAVTTPGQGESDSQTAHEDSTASGRKTGLWYKQPTAIMLRSVLVPGWGQWTNGQFVKAVIVAGGEGYLISQAIDATRKEREAKRLAREESDSGPAYLAQADRHGARRRDFTWWTLFAVVLSMGDAYVDAHLRGFDEKFPPEEQTRERGALDSSSSLFPRKDPAWQPILEWSRDEWSPSGFSAGVRLSLP